MSHVHVRTHGDRPERRKVRHRRAVVALVAASLLASAGVATEAPASAAPPFYDGNEQRWDPCFQFITRDFGPVGVPYECTKIRVPLDHDDPSRGTIPIALTRIRATDTENYRGSLFLNPGGPGGSGVEMALFFGPVAPFVWGPVANQYDIIGFDPRGIGRSSPLRCFRSVAEAESSFPPSPFPLSGDELPWFERASDFLDKKCDYFGSKMLNHMSTANVARDLELMRRRLGDDQLNYVGLSYGTMIGQTYANMYPDKVGAMVIDGVLDPIAWSNTAAREPFSAQLRSDAGAQATLDEFFRQCEVAGPGNCALAPDPRGRLDELLRDLRDAPVTIRDPFTGDRYEYTYAFAIGDLLGALYTPSVFADLAWYIAEIEGQFSVNKPLRLGRARADLYTRIGFVDARGFPRYFNFAEGFPGVSCSDSTFVPGGEQLWFDVANQAAADHGRFGEIWTWASGPCTQWSHFDDDAYRGPFATATATPMLVIGNLYDPATRYEGATTANGLLSNSVLLTVDEPGHTSLGISGCAGFLTGLYLADPVGYASAPPTGFCPSEGNWFDKVAGPPAGGPGQMAADFRRAAIDEIAFRP